MVKRDWSDAERKAFGERMAAAREAKKQPQTQPQVKATQAQRPGSIEPSITREAAAQGFTPPANADRPRPPMGTFIKQLPDDVLYGELEKLTLEEFVKKHTDDGTANIDAMARVTRLSRDEIFNVQKELGYSLPEGVA